MGAKLYVFFSFLTLGRRVAEGAFSRSIGTRDEASQQQCVCVGAMCVASRVFSQHQHKYQLVRPRTPKFERKVTAQSRPTESCCSAVIVLQVVSWLLAIQLHYLFRYSGVLADSLGGLPRTPCARVVPQELRDPRMYTNTSPAGVQGS